MRSFTISFVYLKLGKQKGEVERDIIFEAQYWKN